MVTCAFFVLFFRRSYQETLEAFAPPDSKSTERLHSAVAHYIVTCQRPLNTVEKEGFKDMLKAFKPGYKVLTRRALTDKYIPKLSDEVIFFFLKIFDYFYCGIFLTKIPVYR